MKLPKSLTAQELKALARLAETQDGLLIFSWLQRNADAYMEASLNPASDALSRQAQGGYGAVTSFLTMARAAGKPATQTE